MINGFYTRGSSEEQRGSCTLGVKNYDIFVLFFIFLKEYYYFFHRRVPRWFYCNCTFYKIKKNTIFESCLETIGGFIAKLFGTIFLFVILKNKERYHTVQSEVEHDGEKSNTLFTNNLELFFPDIIFFILSGSKKFSVQSSAANSATICLSHEDISVSWRFFSKIISNECKTLKNFIPDRMKKVIDKCRYIFRIIF